MDIFGFCGQLNSGRIIVLGEFTGSAVRFFGENSPEPHVIAGGDYDFSGSAICLGDFDGVHLGHSSLFELAKKYGRWGVLVFDRSLKESKLLTTLEEKLNIIREMGADYAVIIEMSEAVAGSTPEEFADFLKSRIGAAAVVAGYDYRFGKGASADAETLVRLCEERQMTAEIAEVVTHSGVAVKSTNIRKLIEAGELEAAARLMGRHYSVSAQVQKGLQNGRKMGFPTANIEIRSEKLLPPDGVYYGKVCGRDAVINIGRNLTFGAEKRTMEAHIPGFDGNVYGATVTAELIEKIRPVMRFESVDDLINQIKKDVEYIRRK